MCSQPPFARLAALFILISFPLSLPVAQAYSISDHRELTRVAVSELELCGKLTPSEARAFLEDLVDGNVNEDLNVIRKWGRYSHYFHPHKKLDMRREDSSVTVDESQREIRELLARPGSVDRSAVLELLGRVIHHLQDSSVPPHVVPVDHGLSDGFEGLEIHPSWIESSCARLVAMEGEKDLLSLLQASAGETLESTRERFEVSLEGKTLELRWDEAFWSEGRGSAFGSYGSFGNRFGEGRIRLARGEARIDARVYAAYKGARMRSAVASTQHAVLWVLDLLRAQLLF